jgi:hypothetical protein
MEEAGDATKRLVVVVPKAVKLKVSNAEDLYEEDSKSPDWMQAEMDLRKDIILMCHDMAQHPKVAPTSAASCEGNGKLDWTADSGEGSH